MIDQSLGEQHCQAFCLQGTSGLSGQRESCETMEFFAGKPGNWNAVRDRQKPILRAAAHRGRTALLIARHCGNWVSQYALSVQSEQ